MQFAEERVGGLGAEVGFDRVNGQVHVGQAPGGGVGFLAVDGDVAGVAAVGCDELLGLGEHAARTAAGVVDAALVGFEHLDEHADDRAWRVELAAEHAFGLGELAEEVLVDAAEGVAGLLVRAREADVGDEVDEALHLDRLDAAAGVVARELVLEVGIVALDGEDGVIDERGDIRARSLVLEVVPASFARHPEDALGGVFVAALQQAFEVLALDADVFQLLLELGTTRPEGVRDVLQKQKPKDDVLIFRGIDCAPQLVGRLPEDVSVIEIRGIVRRVRHACISH